ncbi:4'-phosphopantetheinyl transferase superfamily protein [Streptomyces iconiensis]|uniref:4'-phosphopantetheinyl transferase superfamily protein n=1 Tax=Streptomyces iconiensis TaxID=1384038 RepID=A0ABT6ZUE6_9ACTN|nr:4'-phosphopantetheinyl transferase superfamily protein [Streptomyces iconiensis]MDJ1132692.1 4'-phosphopantetheinyl transferase superfamily protein [Streptomyces iconiensis]
MQPLSAEERARATTFLRAADRDRYLVAHLALRRELAALLGTSPADVPLTRATCPVCGGPHGRPSVEGDPLHFSLSHAGDLVLLAFAGVPIGVDVEEYPDRATVAETSTALHPRERDELALLPEAGRPAAFTRCWTRKEAYLKGTGTGLGEDPSITYVSTLAVPASPPGWLLTDLSVPPGHAAASAVRLSRATDAGPG